MSETLNPRTSDELWSSFSNEVADFIKSSSLDISFADIQEIEDQIIYVKGNSKFREALSVFIYVLTEFHNYLFDLKVRNYGSNDINRFKSLIQNSKSRFVDIPSRAVFQNRFKYFLDFLFNVLDKNSIYFFRENIDESEFNGRLVELVNLLRIIICLVNFNKYHIMSKNGETTALLDLDFNLILPSVESKHPSTPVTQEQTKPQPSIYDPDYQEWVLQQRTTKEGRERQPSAREVIARAGDKSKKKDK